MYFEFNFDGHQIYCLKINDDTLSEDFIAGNVIKEMAEIKYYIYESYTFETKYCTKVTDPIIISELDKLITFK